MAILISSAAWAQSDLPSAGGPAFEVASVKHLKEHGFTKINPFGTNKFIASSVSMMVLIEMAFGVDENQIAGPNWPVSEHYDISANAPEGTVLTYQQVQPRLRRLLEDRFALQTHREMRETGGYDLVIAKDGPKLQPTAGISGQGEIWPGAIRLKNSGTDVLAAMLARPAGKPVADKTGLTGKYDIVLEYAPPDAADSPLPSMFTALQEKLGLKLEPRKLPIEILVIDHIEKIPTEN